MESGALAELQAHIDARLRAEGIAPKSYRSPYDAEAELLASRRTEKTELQAQQDAPHDAAAGTR